MAPVASKTVYLFLALVALPHVLAGPACAYRNRGKEDCIKKCKSHWGYGGHRMGQDKWGSVINSSKDQSTDSDSALSTACSLDKTATSDPVSIPTDPSSSSSSKPPPPVTSSILSTSSELPSNFTSSSTSTSSSSTSSTPTTTYTPSSTPIPPPPSPSPSKPPPTNVEEKPSPSPSSDKPSPSPSPKPSTTPKISVTDDFKEAALTGHNNFRANHGASPLTWNDTLAGLAESWASGCVFEHSGGKLGRLGENLAAGTGPYTVTNGIKGWTDEAKDYNPGNPVPSHFTQVVWKGSKQLGCAEFTCPPGSIFDQSFGTANYIVCEYSPPGNVIGQFGTNVQA